MFRLPLTKTPRLIQFRNCVDLIEKPANQDLKCFPLCLVKTCKLMELAIIKMTKHGSVLFFATIEHRKLYRCLCVQPRFYGDGALPHRLFLDHYIVFYF